MTDIEKRIEQEAKYILEELKGLPPEANYFGRVDHIRTSTKEILSVISNWKDVNRWRNVEEALPEMGFRVLIRNSFNVIHMGYIDTVGDWRYCLNNSLMKDNPVEWKPID